MTAAPTTSIVVPTRGGVSRLPHLFSALRDQTDPSWEAIVVVDGDIDGTSDLLSRLRRELPVTPIVFPENRGRAAALNAGLDAARGDVLVRCDDDLRPRPDYVASHVARHSAEPRGVVGLYLNIYPDTPYARAYGHARDERFRSEAYAAAANGRWRYWAGNVSVTRDTFQRVGPYDTDFRAYGWEDVDWGYRLHRAGAEIVLAGELETPHHVAATTTHTRVVRAFHSGAARHRFDLKHGAAALGAPQRGGSVWDALVDVSGRRLSLPQLRALARLVDRTAAAMPARASEKAISWLIESAAQSGRRRPAEVDSGV